ncbi:hypothetical protein ACFOSC_11915 [Streptantibioticus rubrisoli]|uniref:Uncharacterized protein n=1 Tax=Streptantibioticus rubrisoli TaxID=1387313 RepID=A0ABT1P8G6_9ACTN|nr:hypothetical protein [Streptantibioticus rubrisoli]MCQ4041659.1 hypothetical protein [Streptantibioticus rubrisoli]
MPEKTGFDETGKEDRYEEAGCGQRQPRSSLPWSEGKTAGPLVTWPVTPLPRNEEGP